MIRYQMRGSRPFRAAHFHPAPRWEGLQDRLLRKRRSLPSASWWPALNRVEYYGPDFNDGYREGINGRKPDRKRMSNPSYFEGWQIGMCEQECPQEYRHILKDSEIEEEAEARPIRFADPEKAMASAKNVMERDAETMFLLAAIERGEREGWVEVNWEDL